MKRKHVQLEQNSQQDLENDNVQDDDEDFSDFEDIEDDSRGRDDGHYEVGLAHVRRLEQQENVISIGDIPLKLVGTPSGQPAAKRQKKSILTNNRQNTVGS
jgi:hypothetical protein